MITFANDNPNEISGQSQNQMILNWMREGKRLTSLDALNYLKCFRLASRISDLKKEGHAIFDEWVKLPSKKKVKVYFMKEKQAELL